MRTTTALASSSLSSLFSLAAAAMLALPLGCAAEVAPASDTAEGESTTADEGLSATKVSYVVLRHDDRKCMSPLCGGFWIRDANRPTQKETYVSALDLSQSGLGDGDAAKVTGAPATELVLAGKLGPVEKAHGTRPFVVTEAYRGMPGVVAASGETFYQAHDRTPAIQCFAAPCNNEIAEKLNFSSSFAFTTLSVARAAKPFVDQTWLARSVLTRDAIVSATTHNGAKMAAGYEKVVDASQVFVRIPNKIGPCPLFPIAKCPDPRVNVWSRNADLCEVPAGCAQPGICPMFMPACPEGYTLSSWTTSPSACNAYACDPSFLTE
jgi:hypothetical protein